MDYKKKLTFLCKAIITFDNIEESLTREQKWEWKKQIKKLAYAYGHELEQEGEEIFDHDCKGNCKCKKK
jgi:hypothetical protein